MQHQQLTFNGITKTMQHQQLTFNSITKTMQHQQLTFNSITKTIQHQQLSFNGITKTMQHQQLTFNSITKTIQHQQLSFNSITKTMQHQQLTFNGITKTVDLSKIPGILIRALKKLVLEYQLQHNPEYLWRDMINNFSAHSLQSTLDISNFQGTNKFVRDIESSTNREVILCKLIMIGPIV